MAEIARKVCTNSFLNGMNKDTDDAYLEQTKYRHAENLRILSDKNDQLGSINNIRGNIKNIDSTLFWTSNVYKISKTNFADVTITVLFNNMTVSSWHIQCTNYIEFYETLGTGLKNLFPAVDLQTPYNREGMLLYSTNPNFINFTLIITGGDVTASLLLPYQDKLIIIGDTFIRDEIFLFTCPSNNTLQSGQIWKLTYDLSVEPQVPTLTLLYNNILNFSSEYPITGAKGNFENNDCKKIYFTDNNNYLRSFNTADPNGFAFDPGVLDIMGDVVLTKPRLYNIGTGSKPCGTAYYSYRLYNKYGGETAISPTSGPIPLGIGSIAGSNDFSFHGGSGTENSGKSISIEIKDIDRRYSNIQIFSVLYVDSTSDPEITKVADLPITEDDLVFTDDGNNVLAAISQDEFSVYGKKLFQCKTIEVKNSLLLAGNIKEHDFNVDFDARAYRFDYNTNLAKTYEEDTGAIFEVDPDTFKIDSGSRDMPLNYDCINYNPSAYKYKPHTRQLGGAGPNVSFSIKCMPIQIGYVSGEDGQYIPGVTLPLVVTEGSALETWSTWINDEFIDNKNTFTGFGSPFNVNQFKGYKRGEKYRFAISFISKKGERSPAKWIADIVMPLATDIVHPTEPALYSIDGTPIRDFRTFYTDANGLTFGVVLHVEFNINIPDNIANQISGYEILRVDRPGKDRTSIAQGVLSQVGFDDNGSVNDTIYQIDHGVYNVFPVNNIATFSSPEGIFDKNIDYKQGDKIDYIGEMTGIENYFTDPDAVNSNMSNVFAYKNIIPLYNITPKVLSDAKTTLATIYDTTLINAGSAFLYKYKNANKAAGPILSVGGTKQVLSVMQPNNFALNTYMYTDGNNDGHGVLVDYRRPVSKQYGGQRYSERTLNQYISTHSYKVVRSAGLYNSLVFGGDIYINFFDSQRTIWLLSNEDVNAFTGGECLCFPVESTINLSYRSDKGFIKTRTTRIQEAITNYQPEVSTDMQPYVQTYELYQYNPAYSKNCDIYALTSENLNIEIQSQHDCRIIASRRKTVNKLVDDWLSFLQNTKIDIDANRGPITKLVNLKNVIYAFQDNGLGVASIDDRAVVQSADSTKIVLGTSDVLPRYDYISMTSGSRHLFSIIQSDTAIYFYDASDRQIKVFMGQEGSISDGFGVKSFLYNETDGDILTNDNPHRSIGINGYFDERYNEIVFTFHRSIALTDYFTIAFNENLKCFTGLYTFRAPIYIRHYNTILSPRRIGNADSLYLHNFGEYNTFYEVKRNSSLHYIVNESYGSIKVFDNITVECEITESEINILNDFYTKIRCYNNYQNTDWHNLIYDNSVAIGKETNFSRRERLFKLQIPRNIVDSDVTNNPDIFDPIVLSNANREFRERMRDKLLHVELVYANPNNRKFKSSALSTTYRLSAR